VSAGFHRWSVEPGRGWSQYYRRGSHSWRRLNRNWCDYGSCDGIDGGNNSGSFEYGQHGNSRCWKLYLWEYIAEQFVSQRYAKHDVAEHVTDITQYNNQSDHDSE
jgi:hypothetical protein